MVLNVLKRNVFVKLPFLGNTSFQIRKNFSDKLTSCNLKIAFTSPVRVQSFFIFKDKLAKMLLSGHVYKHKWLRCYLLWKTKRHFKVRTCEHLGIAYLTGKKVKIDTTS